MLMEYCHWYISQEVGVGKRTQRCVHVSLGHCGYIGSLSGLPVVGICHNWHIMYGVGDAGYITVIVQLIENEYLNSMIDCNHQINMA